MTLVLLISGGIFLLYLLAYFYWRLWLNRGSVLTPPVLLFHKIEPVSEWGITSLKPSKFANLIKSLKEQGFESISIKEALRMQPEDSHKKVLITFDDAYQGIYTNAFPILESVGYTASIFVITGFVGEPNTWDMNWGGRKFQHLAWEQIKELAERGFSFGSHTVNHPDLTRLPLRYIEYELKTSKQDLEDKLGREVAYLSYPFGRFNQRIQQEAIRLGYTAGFSIYPGRSESLQPHLSIKRTAVYRLDSPLSLRIKLEGGPWFWLEDLKAYLINRLSLATTLVKPWPDYSGLYSKL